MTCNMLQECSRSLCASMTSCEIHRRVFDFPTSARATADPTMEHIFSACANCLSPGMVNSRGAATMWADWRRRRQRQRKATTKARSRHSRRWRGNGPGKPRHSNNGPKTKQPVRGPRLAQTTTAATRRNDEGTTPAQPMATAEARPKPSRTQRKLTLPPASGAGKLQNVDAETC